MFMPTSKKPKRATFKAVVNEDVESKKLNW